MQSLKIVAAGSLRGAFAELLAAFCLQTGLPVSQLQCFFGPAGLLRQRIERGESAGLFASASPRHVQRLVIQDLALAAQPFARNQLCVVVRNIPPLTQPPVADVLTDKRWQLATSTPQADPGGDYALELFALLDKLQPGEGQALRQRAKPLVGGAHSPPPPAGRLAAEWLINSGQTDIFISYASHAPALSRFPELAVRRLPAELSPSITYVLCLIKPATSPARQLADFISEDSGQQILQRHGFLPVV